MPGTERVQSYTARHRKKFTFCYTSLCGRVGGGKEVCGMGGMACGSTMFIHNAVQIGGNTNTSSSLTLLRTQPGDTVVWLMTSLYSVRSSPSFISIHHTVYKHICCLLTGQFTDTNSLYSYSLHLDSQRPPSFTRTCTRKSKQSTTTSVDAQCTTSLKLPSLTHIFTVTHSFTQF